MIPYESSGLIQVFWRDTIVLYNGQITHLGFYSQVNIDQYTNIELIKYDRQKVLACYASMFAQEQLLWDWFLHIKQVW